MRGECSKGGYDTPHPDGAVKLWRPGDSIASTVYICHQVVSSPWCVCSHCCCCHCLNNGSIIAAIVLMDYDMPG